MILDGSKVCTIHPVSSNANGNTNFVSPLTTSSRSMNENIVNDSGDNDIMFGNNCKKALDFDRCRSLVQKAAKKKVQAGRTASIRKCLSDVGLSDEQAGNRTMQMRVRREVRRIIMLESQDENDSKQVPRTPLSAKAKVQRHQKHQKIQQQQQQQRQVPTIIEFIPKNHDEYDDDDVSVLTEASDCATASTETTTPTKTRKLPSPMVPLPVVTAITSSLLPHCTDNKLNTVNPLVTSTTSIIPTCTNLLVQQQQQQQQLSSAVSRSTQFSNNQLLLSLLPLARPATIPTLLGSVHKQNGFPMEFPTPMPIQQVLPTLCSKRSHLFLEDMLLSPFDPSGSVSNKRLRPDGGNRNFLTQLATPTACL